MVTDLNQLVLDGGHVYTDISGLPGTGRTRLLLSSVKRFLSLPGNEKAYAVMVDTNGDLNLHDEGEDVVMQRVKYFRVLSLASFLATMIALPAYIDSQPFDTKIVAIDTISNYIRHPDLNQSEKMSVMSSTKKTINKLNNEQSIKVISTSEAVLRRSDDSPAGSASLSGSASHSLDNNNNIGPFFGSHFYQSLNFRQLQIYYEPGNSHTRLVKLLHVKPEISVRFTIDSSGSIAEQSQSPSRSCSSLR